MAVRASLSHFRPARGGARLMSAAIGRYQEAPTKNSRLSRRAAVWRQQPRGRGGRLAGRERAPAMSAAAPSPPPAARRAGDRFRARQMLDARCRRAPAPVGRRDDASAGFRPARHLRKKRKQALGRRKFLLCDESPAFFPRYFPRSYGHGRIQELASVRRGRHTTL